MAKTKDFVRFQRADGLWNFIKPDGTFLSTEWFRYAYDFSEGIAKVQKEENGELVFENRKDE